jgi:glycerophosphoryl diester phosphodiesterase family protein
MADVPVPPPPPPPPPPGTGGPSFPHRRIGEILSAAFELYGRYWRALVPIVAVVVVPLTIVQYLLIEAVDDPTVDRRIEDGRVIIELSSGFWAGVLANLFVAFFAAFISFVLTGAITRAAAGTLIGRELTLEAAFGYGIGRFWSIVWVSLLVGLAVAGGFILLIIPGIIFFTKLAASLPALVVEDRRGTQAMSRSWNLTSGHFWHVLGTVVLAAIIAGLVSSVLTVPFSDSGWFLRAIVASVASIVTTPFTALVTMLVYVDLRARKEGLGPAGLEADLQRTAT